MKTTIDNLKNAGFDVKITDKSIIVSLNREVNTLEVWTASGYSFDQIRASKVGGKVVIEVE